MDSMAGQATSSNFSNEFLTNNSRRQKINGKSVLYQKKVFGILNSFQRQREKKNSSRSTFTVN
jgi:hypothetical protein